MVSAIITTHNRLPFLTRAINSVLLQTYQDIELIVVSDGSNDGTDEYLEKFKDSSNNVKIIMYHPERGGNYARNQGILEASGEYIAFLDDDDEWLPTKIEKQVSVFQSDSSIGLVYVGKNIIYKRENLKYVNTPKPVSNPNISILYDNFIGSTSSVMVKSEIIREVGMFDENLTALQDYDLWIRVCQKCKVGFVKESLLNYYNEFGGKQISDNQDKYKTSYDYISAKYHYLYSQMPVREIAKIHLLRLSDQANRCMRNKNAKLARKYICEAIRMGITMKSIMMYFLSFIPFKTILRLRRLMIYF